LNHSSIRGGGWAEVFPALGALSAIRRVAQTLVVPLACPLPRLEHGASARRIRFHPATELSP
jgi:hypothetical protein